MNGTSVRPFARLIIGTVLFVLVEALTIYAYSFIFMLEGQPARHGDPQLKAWAWVCVVAMAVELVAFVWWLVRTLKRSPATKKSPPNLA